MKSVDELVAFAAKIEGQGTEDHQNCTYTTNELRALAMRLVELREGSTVVEIGVYGGRSASLYLQLQHTLSLRVHLVDNWSWDQARATGTFVAMILEHFNDIPFTLHKMTSEQAELPWTQAVHFLHIDGWHDLPGIEPDCRHWLPHVVPGGIAAFHDSDCEPVAYCIDKYVQSQGWSLLDRAGRTTVWRAPLE
jgi:hypothetical protein